VLTLERFAAIGLLAAAGFALADSDGVVVVLAACLVLVGTFGVETARHRQALRTLR